MGPALIFGAGGQVGRELLRASWPAGFSPIGLGSAVADITDVGTVRGAVHRVRPAVVVNAAAYTAVDKAEANAKRAFAVNGDGAAYLAVSCAEAGVPLIHLSTDYVFAGNKQGPYLEDDPTAPQSVYGASKVAGEAAVRTAWSKHVILRTAWVFGALGNNFVKTMLKLGADRSELRVVADQWGCPTPAAALAGAIVRVAEMVTKGEGAFGTFHAAGGDPTTWHGFAEEIFAIAAAEGRRLRTRVVPISTADYPTAAKRPANSVLDTGKLQRTFGIGPFDWHRGLEAVIAEHFANDAA